MRWFWQKKEIEVPIEEQLIKNRQKLEYEDKTFDVGVTTVLIIFDDGREVHSKVYGNVYQYIDHPVSDGDIFRVLDVQVQRSEETYKQQLYNLGPDEVTKVYDDGLTPTIAWTGKIRHMEIASTDKYDIHFRVAKLVEITE